MRFSACLVAVGVTLAGSVALATEPDVVYQKHQVVKFDDDTIDGDISRPEVVDINHHKRARLSSLIEVRRSFRTQILRSLLY